MSYCSCIFPENMHHKTTLQMEQSAPHCKHGTLPFQLNLHRIQHHTFGSVSNLEDSDIFLASMGNKELIHFCLGNALHCKLGILSPDLSQPCSIHWGKPYNSRHTDQLHILRKQLHLCRLCSAPPCTESTTSALLCWQTCFVGSLCNVSDSNVPGTFLEHRASKSLGLFCPDESLLDKVHILKHRCFHFDTVPLHISRTNNLPSLWGMTDSESFPHLLLIFQLHTERTQLLLSC